MSSLERLGIAGFRSYHPQDIQFINFFKPLTLICGENGSGKTTIIECLRLIATGKTPPNTNSGKTFVIDPILLQAEEAVGTVKLQFMGPGQRRFVATKTVQLAKITKKGNTKIQYKSIEQQIKTRDPKSNELISINHHCAEIQKQVPNLFGMTPSIMENVIFCHQEESLWPFSDNNTLKSIFDELFDTKALTRSYDGMKDEVKKLTKEVKELSIKHDGVKQMQLRLLRERKIILDQAAQMANKSSKLPILKQKMAELLTAAESWEKSRGIYKEMLMDHASFKKERDIRLMYLGFNIDYCQNEQVNNPVVLQKTRAYLEQQLSALDKKCKACNTKICEYESEYMKLLATESKKQIVSLLSLEVRRIKESIPNVVIGEQDNTCSKVIKKLKNFDNQLQHSANMLQKLKQDYRSIKITELIGEDEEYYQGIREQYIIDRNSQASRADNLKAIFKRLYKPISESNRKSLAIENPRPKLTDTECLLRDRQSVLARYTQLLTPSKSKSQQEQKRTKSAVKRDIEKMSYVGVELQKQLFDYCKVKKKCHFCSKPFTEDEIRQLENKCQKTMKNAQNKIEAFQKQLVGAVDDRNEQYNRAAIKHITQQIEQLKKEKQKLLEKDKIYSLHAESMRQLEITVKLEQITQQLPIEFDRTGGSYNDKQSPSLQAEQLTKFVRLVQEYVMNMQDLKRMQRQLQRGESIKEENKKRQRLRLSEAKKKSEIQQQILEIEQRLKIKPLVDTSIKRLQDVVASGKQNSLVELAQVQTIPPPSTHSSSRTKELYSILMARKSEYNVLYEELTSKCETFDQITKKVELANILIKLKEVQTRISSQQMRQSEGKKKHQEYLTVKQQHDQIEAIVQTWKKDFEMKRIESSQYDLWKITTEIRVIKRQIEQYTHAMRALDKALLDFHKEKMETINCTLKETWQDVYHGSDIKYIQIKAIDEETSKRKTYGYSVTMILPDDTEIEMKGRCSMGQKVLASIVIRLALAESFEGRCSILALDEPTTNLDHEHIQKLGVELSKLLASRRELTSFQLIIISHDTEFMKMLKEFATQYYFVRKDPKQNKFSRIEAKPIEQLK